MRKISSADIAIVSKEKTMNPSEFLKSADQFRSELNQIAQRHETSRRELKHSYPKFNIASNAVLQSGEKLGQVVFGAGMSSKATLKSNEAKQNIRSTLIEKSVTPARSALVEARESFNQI